MVFLALTESGLKSALSLAEKECHPVWCGSNAISEEAYAALNWNKLSRFNYDLSAADPEVIADALDTIAQHHPDSVVWVEASSTE